MDSSVRIWQEVGGKTADARGPGGRGSGQAGRRGPHGSGCALRRRLAGRGGALGRGLAGWAASRGERGEGKLGRGRGGRPWKKINSFLFIKIDS